MPAFPHRGLAFLDNNCASVGKQGKAEGAARLPLAFRAMARIDGKRRRSDLVRHASALAAAG
jgi:hypothetical protein